MQASVVRLFWRPFWRALGSIWFLVFTSSALAQLTPYPEPVRIFSSGAEVREVPAPHLSSLAKRQLFADAGAFAEFTRSFILSQVTPLGLDTQDFKLSRFDREGSLRFQQVLDSVPVEGAEAVAILNPATGDVSALNLNVVDRTRIQKLSAELTLADAKRIATQNLGYAAPDFAEDASLRYVLEGPSSLLVWNFYVRESADGSEPLQVQVIAAGPRKGEIHRTLAVGHGIGHEASEPLSGRPDIFIYDASLMLKKIEHAFSKNEFGYKGVLVLKNGDPTLAGHFISSDDVWDAQLNFSSVLHYFKSRFGRKSFDDNDAAVHATVRAYRIPLNDTFGYRQNAAWLGPWKFFMFGSGGELLGNFVQALDVVGHEFTHAVVHSTSKLRYIGQSGALDEHFADFFGEAIDQLLNSQSEPFLIGEDVYQPGSKYAGKPLRNMLHPELGTPTQPVRMSEIDTEENRNCVPARGNDNCGVHKFSGIPNRATSLMVQELGWRKLEPIVYRTMTLRMRSLSDFRDYRDQLTDECRFHLTASECEIIEEAFATVGL